MKGMKPRVASALLALALLLGSQLGCEKKNPSVLQLPEGTAAADNGVKATPAPLTALGDRVCKVGQETIPESSLFSFILMAADFDPLQGLTLKLRSGNKSADRDFVVSLNYLSVNGYMQDAGYEVTVPAGQSLEGEILIEAEDLRAAGVSTADELILYPLIYDPDVPMGQGDVVDGAFSFYPTNQSQGNVVYPVRQRTATEQTFFDNGYAACVVLGQVEDEADMALRCYLENKTDRFLSFAWSDVAVDGAPVSASGDAVVAPGMRRYVTVDLSGAEEDAAEVAFKVSATPLSNDGAAASPLVEQRGVCRLAASANAAEGEDEPAAAVAATSTPAPTTVIYTSPTSAQKKNAKNGYVNRDKVNLRAGPGTKYKTVGTKIDQNTAVTLYELQDGWWFLKCGSRYGYVKSDYISQGKPKATPTPAAGSKGYDGTVNTQSKAALRKEADTESKCLKELSGGDKLTVYYKTKGKDGRTWYYVAAGKTKGFIRSDLVKTSGKVPSK